MHDGQVVRISVRRARSGKLQMKWQYKEDGPNFYRWFDAF